MISRFGKGCEAQVRFNLSKIRKKLPGFILLDAVGHYDFIAWDPVDGGSDLVSVAGLKGINDA